MLYVERLNFIKDYINHWAELDECSPIENGFKCWGCSALFIVDDFKIHFGFYDPDGQKLAEYLLNAETGIAVMIYDERYSGDRNEYTGALADVLGGLLGSEEYFILLNKPIMVCMDNDDKVYTNTRDLVEDLMRDIMSPFRPRKVENKNNDADLFGIAEVE
jgi:hypothetical protein